MAFFYSIPAFDYSTRRPKKKKVNHSIGGVRGATGGGGQPRDNHGTTTGQPAGQPRDNPRDNHGTTTGQPRDNHGTTTGQPRDNRGTTTGQPRDNHGTTAGQPRDNRGTTAVIKHDVNNFSRENNENATARQKP